MDFGTNVWDVSSEAHNLTQTLFGSNKQNSKHAKKRKQSDASSKSPKVKKLTAASEAIKDVGAGSTSKSSLDVTSPKPKKKRRGKKNKKLLMNNSETSHDAQSYPTNVTEGSSGKKQVQIKGAKQKDAIPQPLAETVNGEQHANDNKDVGKKAKRKRKRTKEAVPDSVSKKMAETINGEQHANDNVDVSKKEKRKRKRSKAAVPEPVVEKMAKLENSTQESSQVNTNSSSAGQGVSEDSKVSPGKDSKAKKKRKRKCKRNKFKDYSKESELKEVVEKEKVNDMNTPTKSEDRDSNTAGPDTKKAAAKKRKRNKKQKKQDNSSVGDVEKNEHSATPMLTSDNKNIKNKTEPVVQSAKPKNTLDRAKLGALLSQDGGKKEASNKDGPGSKVTQSNKPRTLLEKSKERLKAARFRYINEQLYTASGDVAFEMFKEDPDAFQVYHEGFQSQVEKWPANPIDLIIEYVKSRPKHLVVADFGCGDAKLSRSVPNKIHSFDLVALNDHVTVCDMTKVPLADSSVDLAVFCLSLMGTNLTSYLAEANRVLRKGAIMKVAEVTSRFNNLGTFILKVEKMGFKITNQDSSNKMFVMMDFKKTSTLKGPPKQEIELSPCLYKKR